MELETEIEMNKWVVDHISKCGGGGALLSYDITAVSPIKRTMSCGKL